MTAENAQEQDNIYDFFNVHGNIFFRFDAILTKQPNYSLKGYGSLNISLEKIDRD